MNVLLLGWVLNYLTFGAHEIALRYIKVFVAKHSKVDKNLRASDGKVLVHCTISKATKNIEGWP